MISERLCWEVLWVCVSVCRRAGGFIRVVTFVLGLGSCILCFGGCSFTCL